MSRLNNEYYIKYGHLITLFVSLGMACYLTVLWQLVGENDTKRCVWRAESIAIGIIGPIV